MPSTSTGVPEGTSTSSTAPSTSSADQGRPIVSRQHLTIRIGIGLGVSGAVIAGLLGTCAYFLRRKRRRQLRAEALARHPTDGAAAAWHGSQMAEHALLAGPQSQYQPYRPSYARSLAGSGISASPSFYEFDFERERNRGWDGLSALGVGSTAASGYAHQRRSWDADEELHLSNASGNRLSTISEYPRDWPLPAHR